MALAAYLGQVGLDAAEYRAAPAGDLQRDMLLALFEANNLVRKAGVNLNQAVKRLNATGQPGPDLSPAAAYCVRVVRHVDEAAQLIQRRMP
jgi:hypothetical protein